MSTFALNQAALLRGLEAGNQLEQILAWLSEWTHKELPQNVEYSLHDWSRGYIEAHLEEVILVELSSPAQGEEALYRALSGGQQRGEYVVESYKASDEQHSRSHHMGKIKPDLLHGSARQLPAWEPGMRHGYHALSLGWHMGELIRRVDPRHRSLGQFFQSEEAPAADWGNRFLPL